MPRIPTATLDAIKAAAPLARVLSARGFETRERGGDLVCSCPVPGHDDKSPSFHVTPNDAGGVAHCFGCDWAGNAIQLIQALDDCSFIDAVAQLAQLGGVDFDADYYRPPSRLRIGAGKDCPLDHGATGAELDDQMISFAQGALQRRGSAGRAYLEHRGVWSADAAARFRLGFLPSQELGRMLQAHKLHQRTVAGKTLRASLMAAGWWNVKSGHR
jgi:DNA primase